MNEYILLYNIHQDSIDRKSNLAGRREDVLSSKSNEKAGYGVKSSKDIKVMEKAQPLSDHPLAIDAVRIIIQTL